MYVSLLPGTVPGGDVATIRRVGSADLVYAALLDGGFDPVGDRIVVLPQNPERAVLRDPKSGFADFVAKGSIAKGAALAAGVGQ